MTLGEVIFLIIGGGFLLFVVLIVCVLFYGDNKNSDKIWGWGPKFWIACLEYIVSMLIVLVLAVALLRGLPHWKIYDSDEERAFAQTTKNEFFKGKEWTQEDYDEVVAAYRSNHWIRFAVFACYAISVIVVSIAIPSIAMVQLFKKYRLWRFREKLAMYLEKRQNPPDLFP